MSNRIEEIPPDVQMQEQLPVSIPRDYNSVISEPQVIADSRIVGQATATERRQNVPVETVDLANSDDNIEVMDTESKSDSDVPEENTKNQSESDCEDIDSSSVCTICYSPYTNSGEHRLCCLKCGHLFGRNCIVHWLKTVSYQAGKCPTCNERATLRDVRILYAKTLVALDTSEKDRLIARLETVEQEKNKLQSLLNHSNSRVQLLQEQINALESKIKEMSKNPCLMEPRQMNEKRYLFSSKIITTIKLGEKGCRVLACSNQLSLLLASQESQTQLFPGFGIRKINMHDMKAVPYQNNLHKKEIRDMAFSYHDRNSILTVSLDGTAKLFDIQSNVAVQSLDVREPLWACTWNSLDSNKFICGSQKGTVYIFDRRFLNNDPEFVIELPEPKTGIISLCCLPPRAGRFLPNGGILACRLTNINEVHSVGSGFESSVLPIEGNFLSMRYDEPTDNLLISTRPSKNFTSPRHIVSRLSDTVKAQSRNNCFDVLHTFYGARSPKVLSRSAFVSTPRGDQLICAYNERDTTIDAWSMISEKKMDTKDVHLPEPILDICSFQRSHDEVLLPCLSDSRLNIVKFRFE